MRQILWMAGQAIMFIGILFVTFALYTGIMAGNLGQEYALWGIGGVCFLIGLGLRSAGENS